MWDFDSVRGVVSVTKARIAGVDRDRTKTNEDRRVVLCPRARAVLERQLQLREHPKRAGRIDHEHLFFHANGTRLERIREPYQRWHRTLRAVS